MTDQELARERAVRELARLLAPVTNLKNPEAAAAKYVDWLYDNDFRHVPRPPVITATTDGVPADKYADDLAAVRKACATASDKHHRKDAHHA